jgi:BirA family biotin operon repressor/biotin-[acetyl-CoA-carboxylase] ligase
MINVSLLQKGLQTASFGRKIYAFETIDSTNSCARVMAAAGAPEGTVVIAELQTSGRGRMGRSWVANPQENLTFSVVLRPGMSALNLLPLLTGIAVGDAVREQAGVEPDCKWPNDLLLGGRKFCGILLEGSLRDEALEFAVAGIGINVNQILFPPDLSDRATSLRLICGREFNREELLRTILHHLEHLYQTGCREDFSSVPRLWTTRAQMIGRPILIQMRDTRLAGTARRIAPDGGLVIATDSGEQTVYAGDVTFPSIEQPAP